METTLVIVVLFLIFGGGGLYWRRQGVGQDIEGGGRAIERSTGKKVRQIKGKKEEI
jgi:hypothetical protein